MTEAKCPGQRAYDAWWAVMNKHRDAGIYARVWEDLSPVERACWAAAEQAVPESTPPAEAKAEAPAVTKLRMIQNRCWKEHGHRYDEDGECLYCYFEQPKPPEPR